MEALMKNIWRIIPVLLLSVAMAGCSDDDDTTSSFFELSSTDLECNSNNVIDVVVPIEGQTYKLTVKSSVDVIWTTKLEGGSWIVATPVTKQSGDGEILIVASSNPTNIKNRVATVTIRNSVNDEIYRYAFTQSYDPNQMAQKEELYAYIHYNEDRYNKEELIYTTSINKVEGNVSISSLGQEELDKYNEDNLTLYKLLPTDCYTLPNSISFDGEVSALLDIKFNKKTGDLSTSEEYMLPIIVSVDDRKAELIWLVVNIYDRNISRSVKQFDFYNANQDITTLLTINKEEGEVTLSAFTEEELNAHNSLYGTRYMSIPEDYIVMPASVDFDDSDLSKDVKITFKKEVGELDEDKEYVWGIRVYVDGFPVSEIFMKPRIATPVVTMESKEYKHILILDQGEKKASYGFNLSLDVINQWEFTVEFEENETALKAAVDKYNADKGTSYTLLPKGNCVLSSSEFTQEDNEKLVTATLSGDGLTLDKDYLYPIIPIGCGNSPFEVKEKITYVHVIMETKVESISDLRSINLEANMLKASATDGGNNVGNLLAYNNYWQSIWSPNGGKNDPKIDPVYGVYLDIDFSNKPLSQAFSFNYLPRNWPNAVPNEIVVYAGTSNDDLKKIGELKYEDNQLPFADKTWIGRVSEEDLSKLSLYSLKESGATLVRLSFISSRDKTYSNNSVKNILGYDYTKWNNSGDYPCVALQQLKIYGK